MTRTSERWRRGLLVCTLALAVWACGKKKKAAPPADDVEKPTPPFTPARALVSNPALGDVNADGKIDRLDVGFLKDYLFSHGQAPLGPADVNGDGKVDVADVFYLSNYVFSHGPAPKAPGIAVPGGPSPAAKKAP